MVSGGNGVLHTSVLVYFNYHLLTFPVESYLKNPLLKFYTEGIQGCLGNKQSGTKTKVKDEVMSRLTPEQHAMYDRAMAMAKAALVDALPHEAILIRAAMINLANIKYRLHEETNNGPRR